MKKSGAVLRAAVCALLCVCTALLMCAPCFAAEALPADSQKTVRIGYIDYQGFITKQSGGTFTGYGVEMLSEIARHTGWKYTYVYNTWDNLLEMLEKGQIDFICHAQITPAREEKFLFSKYSVGSESSILYVRQDDERYFYNDYASFDGMKIAMLANSFQNTKLDECAQKYGFSYTPLYYQSSTEILLSLENGTADAAALGSLAAISGYKMVSRFGADPFYFMTGKQNLELVNELDNALGEINSNDPTYQADLFKKYYSDNSASSTMLFTREEAEYIAETQSITIGLLPGREPLSYEDENGEAAGMAVDLLNIISAKCGIKFKYNFLDLAQTGMDYLANGQGDAVAGVMQSAFSQLNPALLHSDALMTSSVVFVGKTGMTFDPHASLTVALPVGFIGGETVVHEVYPEFAFYQGTTNDDCLDAVRDGRADVMLQNIYVIRESLESPRYEDLQIFPAYSFDENMLMVALPGSETFMSVINKTIASLSGDDINDVVIKHTIGKSYKMTFADIWYRYKTPFIGIILLAFAIVALCVFIIAYRQRSYHKIAVANKKLETANSRLAVAVDSANTANRAKSQFLSRMSHEIRTPMNAIVGITQIAKSHEDEPEKIDEYLKKIDVSSKVLLNIINDVLDMSAIESDKLKIAAAPFDMREVLSGISTLYYAQCKQKGINFIMAVDLSSEKYVGDSLRVNQILLNLVSNAFKFTDAGGTIKVLVNEADRKENTSYVRFEVSDTGAGMTEEMQQRLFKPFEQESATTAQKHGGSGLGMSIAKNLVDMMHGSISVKSKKGEGTSFTVNIPFEVQQSDEQTPAAAKNLRALIIDEDEHSRECTATVFGRIGVQYMAAANAAEALEALDKAFDQSEELVLCVLDWPMNDADGLNTITEIRKYFDNDMVMLAVSAYDISDITDKATAAGADMFIPKLVFQSTVFNLVMQLSGGKYTKDTAKKDSCDFTGRRILLAEDNDLNREIATELLTMVHATVETAVNGRLAVDMYAKSAPGYYDVILMDIQMPVMDGYEAAKAIRALDKAGAKDIPILAMTANAFEEDVSAALSAGMNGHIAKPIDTELMYKTIAKWCKD